MDIIIFGASGRMGRIVAQEAKAGFRNARVVASVSRSAYTDTAAGTYPTLTQFDGHADCVVDFSNHAATAELMACCTARSLPVVVATTGHTEEELAVIRAAAERIPVFLSANMSVGVALLADLAKRAASVFPDAEIEIIERHHDQKLDVPSGTALLLARRMQEARSDAPLVVGRHENGKRTRAEIGIHSLRYGNEVGTHEIIIAAGSETITLAHKAENRSLFAQGALTAAAFLCGKEPGLYDMRDIVN